MSSELWSAERAAVCETAQELDRLGLVRGGQRQRQPAHSRRAAARRHYAEPEELPLHELRRRPGNRL